MIAKAGLGVIGLGAISIGGVAFTKPEWLGINKEVPWTPLSKDHSFSASSDTFGSKYKGVLTGVVGTKSGENTNEDWWNKSFEQLKIDSKVSNSSVGTKFKYSDTENDSKVSKGISGTKEEKGLNQICNEVYKAQESKITDEGSSEDEYKKSDVWKYCSPVGAVPKKVSEQTDELGSNSNESWIGKTKGGELLSTKHKDNEKLWELKNDEFFGRGVFKSATSRTFDSNDKFFKALFDQKNSNTNKDALKNKCEEAYKLTSEATPSNENKTNDAHVVKYCSLKSI